MNTIATYYAQPYLKSLEAKVLAITEEGVVLDRTICYPEGGGQSGDRGSIGGCPLLDTIKDEQKHIFHKVQEPTFSVGDTVSIDLDWEHRYHYMQMHTAQHIASGILFSRFGIGTVSVHQGEKALTIETDTANIDETLCYQLEDAVNKAVVEAHPVSYEVHTQKEAEALPLRRTIKVKGDGIRLVVIEGIDTIACGGLHTENTREVGLFQYTAQEKIRGHVRLVFSVGQKALEDIRENRSVVMKLSALFSAPKENLAAVAEVALRQAVLDKSLLQRKGQRLAEVMLEALVTKAEKIEGIPVVLWKVIDDLDFKQIAQVFALYPDLALCAAKEEEGRLLWLVGLSGKASSLFDFPKERAALLTSFQGKGGGRPPLWQGMGMGEAADFLDSFRRLLE
ncbi:putative metal-dependent hydrolase related to alanyl-tRNA synthetase HxxxH domain protein [Sphaerochaeta pleomorpha str. Grapes]|uniref:Alanine--tRNA ligase n=1 Tax=Sphaerochaeta pleomorpha (strain ATCC BAA-1885 / DSM 22778 / Grapes) TaxID=158190 RepID=G8QUE0_SPHPG|nr:alanyl-tRNA editing protein [Sphaerochaeta pleomorpha]AEV29173.1 putative metal-dependent hydrolase related to alanyl-tRNA synthetase HxxxH domain protein [Sphaerochaeta pleomorpha str. Grapes]